MSAWSALWPTVTFEGAPGSTIHAAAEALVERMRGEEAKALSPSVAMFLIFNEYAIRVYSGMTAQAIVTEYFRKTGNDSPRAKPPAEIFDTTHAAAIEHSLRLSAAHLKHAAEILKSLQ